jgi:glycosyltransferase involved in cell wall biosynthesis
MKILLVHNHYQQYGGEDAVFEAETNLLRQKGHTVEQLTFQNVALEGVWDKIKTSFTSLYNFNSVTKLKQAIASFKPDLIHVHNFWKEASPSIFFEAQKHKIPVVMTLHNYRLICSNALLMRENKPCELCVNQRFPLSGIKYGCFGNKLITAQTTAITGIHKMLGTWQNKITHYICLTEFARQKFIHSSLQLKDNQISVKPNFVKDFGYNEANSRENFFLFVGRLSEEKGIKTLLEACKNTSENIEIIGSGDFEKEIQTLCQTQPNIKFWSLKDKNFIIERLKRSQALLMPSVCYEGLPTTILEAFSTGTPVIVSDIDNLNTIVTDGYNGIHFKTANSSSLKEKIEAFSSFPKKETLYQNARKTFEENYTEEVVYEKLMKIYKLVTTQLI